MGPWRQPCCKKNKWGVYETERSLFDWVREGHSLHRFAKSPEAAIMDWADDITYAVHDLVDFYCAGQIPMDRLADDNDPAERDNFFSEVFARCQDLTPGARSLRRFLKKSSSTFLSTADMLGLLNNALAFGNFQLC